MSGCRITEEYQRRGADIVILENESLRVEVLAGKGSDVTEIRDKRTDINILFESPHEWHVPDESYLGAPDPAFTFMDHYPGGWQDVLPGAGGPATVAGAPLPLHGEAPLVPWETTVTADSSDEVAVLFSLSLSRYPFEIERELILRDNESILHVEESVKNRGHVGTDYSWLQHIALGAPLIGPNSRLDVSAETVIADPDHDVPNTRFTPGETYSWPVDTLDDGTEVDLRKVPAKEARIHDLVAITDLTDGRYTVTNPDLDLSATVRFPADIFEYLWYWGAFGGFEAAPYFGRNYNLGLEPSTSIPNAGLERAIENGTANHLAPGEAISADFEIEMAAANHGT